ncbi:hypothetical protein A2Z33_02170 [Candidatus Gottesmanbacteria bacterium RBG_16_52_11]|uniref:Uncharacterized protein n=1 Tax=Candidatus Gottesmanbacteria bacterium RBG_16_52_11 TaxID=1798374 RepID=A0A1F5YR77_9BACT|nr:MAG: hypothetical protein A2Z33_02170 [Candidatus Gottesmanbacteria bacterium RBG_16_52_11]
MYRATVRYLYERFGGSDFTDAGTRAEICSFLAGFEPGSFFGGWGALTYTREKWEDDFGSDWLTGMEALMAQVAGDTYGYVPEAGETEVHD